MAKKIEVDFFLVAEVTHTVSRRLALYFGDKTLPAWSELTEAQQHRAVSAVVRGMAMRPLKPELAHAYWAERKRREGWRLGRRKYTKSKLHPGLKSYARVSTRQKIFHEMFADLINLHGFVKTV